MKNVAGEYRWFHTFGTIFERDENRHVKSVLNISIDVTDQEMAEQSLFQKNLELQQSNTSLEEYAYVASHDLKEPLRKIVTFSDRILTFYSDTLSEDARSYMGKVIDSSRRMQKMINELLYVSTIAGNKDFQLCDLNFVLSEALHPLDHKIEEVKAIVDSDTLPTVLVVPSQFGQLFQNLIGNALKFIRKGVVPTIKITHSFVSSMAVERHDVAKAKRYLKIEIHDNGIGFDNQYANRIFAIFQRLHGRTEYEGTGIGLAVCKKIVENHGGAIYARGKINEGAEFTIIIPV
jgi:light-regulated signal transduction histidine kinase (bacteriophytochrome)